MPVPAILAVITAVPLSFAVTCPLRFTVATLFLLEVQIIFFERLLDKRLIPLGTKVKIGKIVYTAEDTGGAIKGKRIDVYYSNHRQASAHGVKYRKIKVYI